MSTESHHAFLVRTPQVQAFVEDLLLLDGEVVRYYYEKLGIDEARLINTAAHIRPIVSDIQTFVIRTHFVTLEAQNALLKVVEEPPASSRFILIVPSDFAVLPTILSRCNVYVDTDSTTSNQSFVEFLAADFKTRLALIDIAAKAKDVQWQRDIKNGLIFYLTASTQGLIELEYCTRLLLTRGASNKFLLEHVALTLPASSRV